MSASEKSPPGDNAATTPLPQATSLKPKLTLLVAEGLSKVYPPPIFGGADKITYALKNVSLFVRNRETLGLVGESGSGKSTLARVLVRLQEPTAGRIVFEGVELTRLSAKKLFPYRRKLQIVFQDPQTSLNPRLDVSRIVAEGLDIHRMGTPNERRLRVSELLMRVGLDANTIDKYPNELSGGQRQRIAIARALAVEPKLLVCDEPTSQLDPSVQAQIIDLLERMQERHGLSYVFVSHDLAIVRATSHRVGVLYGGEIVEMGPTKNLFETPLHPYTRALMASMSTISKVGKLESPSARREAKPTGCAYFEVCPKGKAGVCDDRHPDLVTVVKDSSHRVACHFPGDETSEKASPSEKVTPSEKASPSERESSSLPIELTKRKP